MPNTIITLTDKPGYTDVMGPLRFVNGRCEMQEPLTFVQERMITRMLQAKDYRVDVRRGVLDEPENPKPRRRERGSG